MRLAPFDPNLSAAAAMLAGGATRDAGTATPATAGRDQVLTADDEPAPLLLDVDDARADQLAPSALAIIERATEDLRSDREPEPLLLDVAGDEAEDQHAADESAPEVLVLDVAALEADAHGPAEPIEHAPAAHLPATRAEADTLTLPIGTVRSHDTVATFA